MKFRLDKKMIKSNIIYIVAGVLLIVLIVVIVLAVKGKKNNSRSGNAEGKVMTLEENTPVSGETFELDAYPEVNALIAQYFNASAAGDLAVLDQMVTTLSDTDKTIIERKSGYIESYNEIAAYTQLCPQEGSYLVFATYKIKFVNKNTMVPGLDTLYIRTSEDGRMYIYNGAVEPEVSSFLNTAVNSDAAKKLINRVNDEYINTLAADADILAFIEKFEGDSELIAKAKQRVNEAASAAAAAQAQAASEAAAAAQAQAQAEAAAAAQAAAQADANAAAAAQAAAQPQQTNETVALTSTVNVRRANDENSEKIGSLTIGENVTRLSLTDNGWSKIQFNGQEGYVKTEFVSTFRLTGDTVKAATAVNVRVECSETAKLAGKMPAGESCKRNAIYDNGWSQIVFNGAVSYVKTEFLTN